MPLELGCFVPPIQPEPFMEIALQAEKNGYDFVTMDDHMMYPFGAAEGTYGAHDAWTAMSFVAGATTRIKVSHMVLITTFRGPGLLAKMGATLDVFSKGRLDLTVGAGWFEREFNAYDFPWENHEGRLKRLRESVEIIRALWTQPSVTYEGEFYRLKDAEVLPKPIQQPTPPIWIGGDSKRSMQLAADLGDGLLVHAHQPDEINSMYTNFKKMLGDKQEGFGLGMAVFVVMADDPQKATRKVESMIPPEVMEKFQQAGIRHELNNRISGNAEQCLEQITAYRKLGMNRLITIFLDPEDAGRFAEDVLPELRRD